MNKILKTLRLRSRFTGYCKFCAGNLVDDGSTDDSLKIAFDYAQKYSFIYFIHYQNKGVGAARNAGLRSAQGEYIFFSILTIT